MIADALRMDIERYSCQAKENPAYKMARDGTLGRENVAKYVFNIRHLLQHTPKHLSQAYQRAIEREDRQLADFFKSKMAEEVGHDQWADQDLEHFRTAFGIKIDHGVTPSLGALLTHLARTIDEDPTLYLAYILFAEYFTVLEGPELLAVLEERCGIPKAFMTAIGNHAELDKEHVAEGLDTIDALVTDPSYLGPMRSTLHQSIRHFDQFLVEVAQPAN
jgi:pyrroloquinoline quinone (PQQ) biosynthesis protein C